MFLERSWRKVSSLDMIKAYNCLATILWVRIVSAEVAVLFGILIIKWVTICKSYLGSSNFGKILTFEIFAKYCNGWNDPSWSCFDVASVKFNTYSSSVGYLAVFCSPAFGSARGFYYNFFCFVSLDLSLLSSNRLSTFEPLPSTISLFLIIFQKL